MRDRELDVRIRDHWLEKVGLLDPGQPTETSHIEHVRSMLAEFTPRERILLRVLMGVDDLT